MGFWKQLFTREPLLSAADMLAIEQQHVQQEFARSFDAQHEAWLQHDYARYVREDYPELLRQRGYHELDPAAYPAPQRPAYALALTGGGIRSASFGIGVIQALNTQRQGPDKPSVFSKLNYLSSVSGGGYAGCALTWYLRQYGLFPFGIKHNFAGSQGSTAEENLLLSYIRTHGKYLVPHSLGPQGLLASILMSVLHSTLVYTLIFTVFFYLMLSLADVSLLDGIMSFIGLRNLVDVLGSHPLLLDSTQALSSQRGAFAMFFLLLGLICAGVFALVLQLYAASSFIPWWFSRAHGWRVKVQRWQGRVLVAGAACLLLAGLPFVAQLVLGRGVDLAQDQAALGVMSGSGVMATVLALRRLLAAIPTRAGGKPGLAERAAAVLTVPAFVSVLLLVAFLLAEQLLLWSALGVLGFVLATLLLANLVNLDQIAPHKMYRDRLMETFMKTPGTPPEASLEERGRAANRVTLDGLATAPHWSPYPLINCNLILSNASAPHFRARLGDSFVLSPLFCGSSATRYVHTRDFDRGNMTLPTAMAISGAAANPHAGNSGEGKSTQPAVSFLMTFFGLRLGYWTFNPASKLSFIDRLLRPNYINPGLCSLLGVQHNERNLFIELSDGGHFDNTGVYELVRRRVPVIIIADGGADPDENFDSFGNMIERCRVDFGVSIRFPDEDYDLTGILPGSMAARSREDARLYDAKYNLAVRGFALGDIVYPGLPGKPGFVGKVVYIKTCMTRQLPGDLYAYKSAHPDFPNQPTLDQFFDERQFESYRELGYQLTKQLLSDPAAMRKLP